MKTTTGRWLRLNPTMLALLTAGTTAMAQTAPAANDGNVAVVTLKQVNVRGEYDREDLPAAAPGGKAATGARLGILGATRIMDAPVHVNAYTRELFEDYNALTLSDVLENDPAVRFTTNKSHLLQNFNLRGLDMTAMDIATNGLYGIAPANQVPIEMFERVEVMRGPNVLLSGMPPLASVAGSINMVTKRAQSKPVADVTVTYGTQSYGQIHADVGRRFGEEQRLGVRVNGVYGKGKMGAKEEKQERTIGALGLDYQGDSARFLLDVYTSKTEIDNGSPGMFNFLGNAAIPGVGRLLAPPKGDVNMFRSTHGEYDNSGVLARAEVDFNDRWMGYLAAGGSEAEGNGLLFGTRAFVTGADGTTRGAVYHVQTKSERSTAEAGVIGKFNTGDVRHRLQLSLNMLKHKEGTVNSACNYCYTTNMYNPVTPVFPSPPTWTGYNTNNDFQSLAVADTMAFAQDSVLLTVGMRHQTVKQPLGGYDASRVSPTIAGVVRPWGDSVSFFGNYTEGLQPGETVGSTYENAGQVFKPIQTKQAELGMKLQTGALTHTLSTYQIEKPSLIEENFSLVEGGKQRLRGLEWSVYGQITPTLSLLGGVTHIKSRQINTGKDTFGVPEWRAQIGLDWDTPVDNLSVGGRVLYTGKQWADSANRLSVPDWNRLDLTARYAMKVGATPVRLNASVENVTDKKYWIGMFGDGFVMAGAPRTFKLSATVSF